MGAVVDGCPAGIPVDEAAIESFLERDVPDSDLGTARSEGNRVEILSGVFEGSTLGTPISLVIRNTDIHSDFYRSRRNTPRPGHGDLTYRLKYQHVDWRGGSRASGRECIGRLAAAAVARQALDPCGIVVESRIIELAGVPIDSDDDYERATKIALDARAEGNSTGGMVQVTISGVPGGVGSPVFGKLEAELARAVMSIGSVRSFAIGDGCAAARSLGSDYNDPIVMKDGRIGTRTNRSGGTLAGITTGEDIWFQFAVKPTPSVAMAQETVDLDSRSETTIRCNGHFDTNITPRVAVIAEAMAWLTVMDQSLAAGLVHPTCFDKSPFLESKPNP